MKKIIFMMMAVVLASCSGSKPAARKLEISRAAISSQDFVGGALVEVTDINGVTTPYSFSAPPFVVMIPDGVFSIKFAGFTGPAAWQGTYSCGGVTSKTLTAQDTSINITINVANCGVAPYSAMVASKVTQWDTALWDTAVWAP